MAKIEWNGFYLKKMSLDTDFTDDTDVKKIRFGSSQLNEKQRDLTG